MYFKTTLENGIRVVTESMPAVRSIAMGVIIDAGLRDEPAHQNGLAHMAEHLMFQGTSNRDSLQIARLMDEAGGQMGAFTARDYTCYTATVLDDYRTYALDLLGDILLNSIFPAEDIEREKNTIIREIETAHDLPAQRADALLKARVWAGHHMGRSISGQPETVRELTREDVIYFVHSQYLPDRMIVAAAGNLNHKDFAAQVRDAFWCMLGESPTITTSVPDCHPGVILEHIPVSQVYFAIGIPAHQYTHRDRYLLHVFNKILGDGISSRLFRRIREERGLVYHISSEYHAYRDAGLLVVEGSTSPEYFTQVLGLTLGEMWRTITGEDPINEEELWKALMQIKGQHLISAENTNTRMSRLATQELYFGRRISTEEILKNIETIDRKTMQRLCDEALVDAFRQATIAVVGPEVPTFYNVLMIEELLNEFN